MRYKPDWEAAQQRWCALWEGRPLDRPCMTVTAPRPGGDPWPAPPASPEARWLDPAYLQGCLRAHLSGTAWLGEAIPSYLLMAGWTVCYGARLAFHDHTIWLDPMPIDWDAPPTFAVDWDDPWLQKYLAVYGAALELAGWDDFLVGRPCLLPGNDLLAAILGGEAFLTNLIDRPDWMREAIVSIARGQLTLKQHFEALAARTHAFPYGNPQWMTFWAPTPYTATQSDVSCMLSPEMFETFIVPELDIYGAAYGALWYHLDGARARQHLPRLLSLPYLRVVQFIPEPDMPPNGPAWLDLYREIQAAGRIVHIQVAPAVVEPLVRALDPRLLVLDVGCGSVAEGEQLLEEAVRWTQA